eukprot:TRINITY_DN20957_c0_g1_i1.p1 TRINITY_DN20957_c0_g1~~TRINITY_DN20957_c0_g1_i1.p1  ORF type:complete len:314 (+),score=86.06 TRINITY_DN20957_c0_g1_i1:55-996(+)
MVYANQADVPDVPRLPEYMPLDGRDMFQDDEYDGHKNGIKVNGFQGQWQMYQIGSWILLFIQLMNFSVLMAPMMRDPGDVILQFYLGFCIPAAIVTYCACSLAQSADYAVFSQPRWSRKEFDVYMHIKYVLKWQGPLLDNHPDRDLLLEVKNGYRRWCTTCHVFVLTPSYHCNATNKCVEQMDHYCKWFNNAVGAVNYHYFALFLLVCFWTSVIQFAVSLYQFIDSFLDPAFYQARLALTYNVYGHTSIDWFRAFIFIGAFFAMAAIVQLGYLFSFHIMLARMKTTTIGYWMQRPAVCDPDVEVDDAVEVIDD